MHWGRILRNIFSNWTSYVVTAAVGFGLAPFMVHALGDTGYGLWMLVISVTGYFGLLDLGIRSSVGRFIARYLALNDTARINGSASTAFLILGCGGLLTLLATAAIALALFDTFRIEPAYASAGRTALLLTGLHVALILPLGVFSSVLIALERFDIVSGITIVGELARAALVVWALQHGYGLVALALITLAIALVRYAAMAVFAWLLHPTLSIGIRHVDWGAFRELFGYSVYRFVWLTASQLIFYTDSIVIGAFLGAAAITPYAIAASLVSYGRNAVALATDAFGPSAARMDANADLAGLRRLLVAGTRVALLVGIPICLVFVFLGRQFITLWMGPAYAGSALFLLVLTIPQLGGMAQFASAFVLGGMARHRALAFIVLAEGIANVVLSIVLVQRMGLVGVAWGTVIPHLVCTMVVIPAYTVRVLNMRLRDYVVGGFARPLAAALPAVPLGYALSAFEVSSWLGFVGQACALCGTFGVTSYFICLDARQRAQAAGRLAVVFHRRTATHEA